MNLWNKLTEYIKGSRFEMKQVTWPTRAQTIRYTILIVIISIAIAAFLGILDFAFTSILKVIL